jgi:hypothetical protein
MKSWLRGHLFEFVAVAVCTAVWILDWKFDGWIFKILWSLVALLVVLGGVGWWLRRWSLWRRDFEVGILRGRDEGDGGIFEYSERFEGKIVTQLFDYEEKEGSPAKIVIIKADAWDELTPLWLRGRRAEVAARIRSVYPPPKYIVCDHLGHEA